METSRFPLDFEALEKGATIPAVDVERITRTSRTDQREYPLALLRLKDQIETALGRQGKYWTIKCCGEDLVILNDLDASAYNDRRFKQAMGVSARALGRQMAVDTSAFSDEQRNEHDRRVEVNSKTHQAARSARREAIRLTAHQRSTPLME